MARIALGTLVLLGALCGPATAAEEARGDGKAPFEMRVLYAPGHFGNSYEAIGRNEMQSLLGEVKHWGYNRYADWFDTIDCSDPFADKHHNLAMAMWQEKKAHFLSAQTIGLACDLILTPNHVYVDQCQPDVAATIGERIFGQLVCPSNPEGRTIILQNYENLFRDLAEYGVGLSALWACPYDYGGCACEDCAPWILTFAELSHDIYQVASKHHPDIEMRFIGWWWSQEEHRLFADWADDKAPGWAKSIALHIPYGSSDVADVPLPKGCERQAFVHIGYAEQAKPKDIYGHLGPVIAAERIQRTVDALTAHGCTGVMAYSEGVFDDVNKCLLAGLSSGRFASSDEVLKAYARRYLGASDTSVTEWAAWLLAWGEPYTLDAEKAQRKLDTLHRTNPMSWRVDQWKSKCALFRIHAKIEQSDEWTAERFELVDAFWAEQEKMQRAVWGLGPQRHVLARNFSPMPWYRDWVKENAARTARASGTR